MHKKHITNSSSSQFAPQTQTRVSYPFFFFSSRLGTSVRGPFPCHESPAGFFVLVGPVVSDPCRVRRFYLRQPSGHRCDLSGRGLRWATEEAEGVVGPGLVQRRSALGVYPDGTGKFTDADARHLRQWRHQCAPTN